MAARPLGTAAPIGRSAFLASKSPFLASPIAGPSKLPAVYVPRMLGVRLYVTPSSVVTKEGPDHPKERGIIGNAVAEVRSIMLTLCVVSKGRAAS